MMQTPYDSGISLFNFERPRNINEEPPWTSRDRAVQEGSESDIYALCMIKMCGLNTRGDIMYDLIVGLRNKINHGPGNHL